MYTAFRQDDNLIELPPPPIIQELLEKFMDKLYCESVIGMNSLKPGKNKSIYSSKYTKILCFLKIIKNIQGYHQDKIRLMEQVRFFVLFHHFDIFVKL